MPLKVDDVVVLNHDRQLQNIEDTDSKTQETINDAIVLNGYSLAIKDASGTAIKTIYYAQDRS